MNKLIGVCGKGFLDLSNTTWLKSAILLYDGFVIDDTPWLGLKFSTKKTGQDSFVEEMISKRNQMSNSDFNGLVKMAKEGRFRWVTLDFDNIHINPDDKYIGDIASKINGEVKFIASNLDASKEMSISIKGDPWDVIHATQRLNDYIAVLAANFINKNQSDEIFLPITNYIKLSEIGQDIEKRSSIINVIIKQFPFISNENSFESILEFKNDEDSYSKHLRLRQWINKTAKESVDVKDLKDELEYTLNEYKSSLNRLKLKYKTSVLSSILTFPFKIWKEPSGVIEKMFGIKEEKIQLMEDESKIPGRELAYLHKINEELK